MAILKFEQNGQGFYDFDALLQATSEEFVEVINSYMQINTDAGYGDKYSVKVQLDKRITNVYIYCKMGTPSVEVFQYYHSTNQYSRVFLMVSELKMLVGDLSE